MGPLSQRRSLHKTPLKSIRWRRESIQWVKEIPITPMGRSTVPIRLGPRLTAHRSSTAGCSRHARQQGLRQAIALLSFELPGKPASFRISPVENFPSLAWFNCQRRSIMKRKFFTVVSGIAVSSFILSSCDTPTGSRGGVGRRSWGDDRGAATGNVRAASIGAAAGAAAGALILGHSIQEERLGAYGPVPPGGWPLARYTDTPGVFRSP